MRSEIIITLASKKDLDSIVAMGRMNRKTLGYMPEGAFRDHLKKQQILVAKSQDYCVGYLMYRVKRSNNFAYIIHLCVDPEYRGQKIARQLVETLKEKTQNLYGLRLSCRRDYGLSKMWEAFGFIARHDKPGRSKDGKLLTVWSLEYSHLPLIDLINEQEIGEKIPVAIDANILYDLKPLNENRQTEDSGVLFSDWIQLEIELCLTDEIDNEINRYEDIEIRTRLQRFSAEFKRRQCNLSDFQDKLERLRKYFPEVMTEKDRSDHRHLARAISSGFQLFVTRDVPVLERAESINEEFPDFNIVRPSDLVIHLDELCRKNEYQPVRLAGTSIQKKLISSGEQSLLIQAFLANELGERKVEFQNRVREFISNPQRYEFHLIYEPNPESISQNRALAIIVYSKNESELLIHLLRVLRGHSLTSTVLGHVLLYSIKYSCQCAKKFTRIVDPYLDRTTISSILQDGFEKVKNGWFRTNLEIADTAESISNFLLRVLPKDEEYSRLKNIANLLQKPKVLTETLLISSIERQLFPAKILNASIPSFIIPIKPRWAEALFDEELAQQSLFGVSADLALRREVVYYRSAKNSGGIQTPGRILWYVSEGEGLQYYQVKSIRACSLIEDVIIDKPKALFSKFRRLGVYEFNDLMNLANQDLDCKIMAIKFSYTEIMKNPVPLNSVRNILDSQITFQSPYKISSQQFADIYRFGIMNKRSSIDKELF